MQLWKWMGLAGIVGAAGVGGTVVVHRRRARDVDHEVTPEELRSRLHDRLRSVEPA